MRIAINYETTKVSFYRFVCNDPEIKSSYVGHTNNFRERKASHKRACNNPTDKIHHLQIYQTIREHGGWGEWKMLEIESRLVKDKREAERIEQEWIDKLKADMNSQKAFRGETRQETQRLYRIENADKIKQYRIENADKLKEQKKEYHIKNADKRKQYCIDNADKRKEQMKQYRIVNADKIKEQEKQYRLKKKEQSKLNASPL